MKIQALLDAIESEIEAIEHSLQIEQAYQVRWDLHDKLIKKQEERRQLLESLPQ